MIQICRPDKGIISSFNTYDELSKHINALETRSSSGNWAFTICSHKRLSYISYVTREKLSTKIEKEAYERELDLIEIYRGDYKNPTQIPVTPGISIEAIKKDWCREYCSANQCYLVEQ